MPTQIPRIGIHSPYSLQINFSASPNIPAGTVVDGTVRLTVGTKALATPLSIRVDIENASARDPDPDKIVTDGYAQYPLNELVFRLLPGSTPSDAAVIASAINGSIVGIIPELDMYQVVLGTATPQQLADVLAFIRSGAFPLLAGATRSYVSAAPSAFPTEMDSLFSSCIGGPDYTNAYDSIDIRRAWDLVRIVNPARNTGQTTVGVLDTGVQVAVGQTGGVTVFHPEFDLPSVNFGNTPPASLTDAAFDAHDPSKRGHGTEVVGIIGANNRVDLGYDYHCPSMNGVLSGIPGFSSRYRIEMRPGSTTGLPNQLANSINVIAQSKAHILLEEIEITAVDRLSSGQLAAKDCSFSALNDLDDLKTAYGSWFDLFVSHRDVLFVLPAGNYDQVMPFLDRADLADSTVELVGGINVSNAITVGVDDTRATWQISQSGVKCQGSNYGPGVEIAAPGSHVYAPKPTDISHMNPVDFYTSSFNGTSAAAPFVAGTVPTSRWRRGGSS